jgi:signal transduction histidine kinase
MDLPAGLPEWPLSTEKRHNLFMAVKEALNNVLKHAGATEVRIGLAVINAKLVITIADNGSGFLAEQARASGDGLANMKQRLERIGGRLVVETQPGAGTKIRMEADEK